MLCVGLAFVPKFLNLDGAAPSHSAALDEPEFARSIEPIQTKAQPNYNNSRREVRIKADSSGHFRGKFKANGRAIEAMIDTGATYVTINTSTARQLGIRTKPSDFIHIANTANGQTKAAYATIKKLEIGSISVRNVESFILDDKSLSSSLIGMSFISQLSSFSVENAQLVLAQ